MHYRLLVSAAALLSLCGIARADTYNIFNLVATLDSGTVTGTVTLDATTGLFSASAISASYSGASYTFSGAPTLFDQGAGYTRAHFASGSPDILFGIDVPLESLVGYTGGSLCTSMSTCGASGYTSGLGTGSSTAVDFVNSGSLVLQTSVPNVPGPYVAVTPEPSTFLLLGTGLAAIPGALRRRLR